KLAALQPSQKKKNYKTLTKGVLGRLPRLPTLSPWQPSPRNLMRPGLFRRFHFTAIFWVSLTRAREPIRGWVMALVSCRECSAECSTVAKTCPHCGILRPGDGSSSDVKRVLGICLLLGVVVIWALRNGIDQTTGSNTATATAATFTADQASAKRRAEEQPAKA